MVEYNKDYYLTNCSGCEKWIAAQMHQFFIEVFIYESLS